jgi:hypothetical protein
MNNQSKAAFLASYLLSVFGYEFVFFVSVLHIFKETRNPVLVGLLTGFTALPKLLAPFYGVLTDRFPKERIFRPPPQPDCTSSVRLPLYPVMEPRRCSRVWETGLSSVRDMCTSLSCSPGTLLPSRHFDQSPVSIPV